MSGHAGRGVASSLLTCAILFMVAAGAAQAQPYTFTRLAGASGGPGNLDAGTTDARLYEPAGIAQAEDGTLYVSTRAGTIRVIATDGKVSTLAGLAGVSSLSDGARFAAGMGYPSQIALDSAGNLFVADRTLSVIRRVTPAGVVTTFAGRAYDEGDANGTGAAARFRRPTGIAIDASDNVYVADQGNHTIRKITPAGVVTTLAGAAGLPGYLNATGSSARFNQPAGIAFGAGALFVADTGNHVIRKVTLGGTVTLLAGLAGSRGSADGSGTSARFDAPEALAVDGVGTVVVADTGNNLIRKVTGAGAASTFAGTAGVAGSKSGMGTAATFWQPSSIVIDPVSGEMHVTDRWTNLVRSITGAGFVSTLAGTPAHIGSNDGPDLAARFYAPTGVATDSAGNVFVADRSNWTIRKIAPDGAVTTYAGTPGLQGPTDGTGPDARFSDPIAVATDAAGNVYVADHGLHTIRKITTERVVTTLAGIPYSAGDEDGPGGTARFREPSDLVVDASGNVYVTDSGNDTIRMITPGGTVSTFAGESGSPGYLNGTGGAARFNDPWAIALHGANLYVADRGNFTIRRVTLSGAVVSWYVGDPGNPGTADGPSDEARIYGMEGLAADSSGNLFFTDNQLQTIRKVSATRVISTIGGAGVGSEDGTGSAARFSGPAGIDVLGTGLVIADVRNHAIRAGKPTFASAGTIDEASAPLFIPRQLGQSAAGTSRHWSIVRMPAGSATTLSATSVSNPTFVPDKPDRYTFRVLAINADSTRSITHVDFTGECTISISPASLARPVVGEPYSQTLSASGGTAPYTFGLTYGILPAGLSLSSGGTFSGTPAEAGATSVIVVAMDVNGCQSTAEYVIDVAPVRAPSNVVATATSATSVSVSWNSVAAAAGYNVYRRAAGDSFVFVGSVDGSATTSHVDSTPSPNKAYLYVVRARNAMGQESSASNADLATTVVFTDPSLLAADVKAVHIEQLRIAIGAVLQLGGQPTYPYTDAPPLAGVAIRAIHVAQLRSALNLARTSLGFGTVIYIDSTLTGGVPVRAVHITQLRDGVR